MNYMDFIESVLKEASEIAKKNFGKVSGRTKPGDNNQVLTDTDIEIGKFIIGQIVHEFPKYNIIDEEAGVGSKGSEFTWVVDPIDGTANFAMGVPTYGTMIGLLKNRTPIAGGLSLPAFDQILTAEKGKGAFVFELDERLGIIGQPKQLHVSTAEQLKGGIVYWDGVMTEQSTPPALAMIERLVKLAGGKVDLRVIGTNVGQQAEVAKGRGELTLTTAVGGFYDIASGALIIKEAGGDFVGIDGKDVNLQSKVAIGGNAEIVRQALPLLEESFKNYKGF